MGVDEPLCPGDFIFYYYCYKFVRSQNRCCFVDRSKTGTYSENGQWWSSM